MTIEVSFDVQANNITNLQDVENLNLTNIQKFYSGAHVFVTGGTGFLGRILIEKLLRSCSNLSALYVLIRNKKGKDLHTRLDEMFDDVVFSRLKEECPKFRHKVVAVGGDCALPDLGLSLQDRKLLIDEVNVIFHVAATVRFDEKLNLAVAINIRSPRDLLKLSKEMPKLKSFMHVSTAYANCDKNVIEEKIYDPPIDSHKLLTLAEIMPEKMLDDVTPSLLEKFPNTYAYTKNVAEDIVKKEGEGLPIGIFRPAIVVSTYKEPIPAWINNMYGPTGVCAGAGTGVLRALQCDKNVNANIVPVDMCCNALIAAAAEVYETYQESKKNEQSFEIPVYNFESSTDAPLTWGTYMDRASYYGIHYPSVKCIWYYSLALVPNPILYYLYILLLHYVPALITDLALLCTGKSPRMFKIYKKIHKFTGVIAYFCTRSWTFKSYNVQKMIAKMSKEDRQLFFCDLKQFNWESYFVLYLKGIRMHLLQDPIDTLAEARVKWNRLYCCHQVIKLVTSFLAIRLLWAVLLSSYGLLR